MVGTQISGSAHERVENQVWDALAEKLYNTALIQAPSAEFIAELQVALRGTPPSTQQRWIETLRRRIVDNPNRHACSSCSHENLLNFVLDPGAGGRCEACGAVTDPPLDLLVNQELFARSRQQARGLSKGDDCQALLESSFSQLCAVSNRIVLLDRFAVADAIRAHEKNAQSSGLQNLLKLADAGGVGLVQLHTAEGFKNGGRVVQAADIPALLVSLIKPLNLANLGLEVVVQSKSVGAREFHDRSVGFVWSSAGGVSFSLGKGMAQFDGVTVSQDHDLLRKSHRKVIMLSTRLCNLARVRVRVL